MVKFCAPTTVFYPGQRHRHKTDEVCLTPMGTSRPSSWIGFSITSLGCVPGIVGYLLRASIITALVYGSLFIASYAGNSAAFGMMFRISSVSFVLISGLRNTDQIKKMVVFAAVPLPAKKKLNNSSATSISSSGRPR